MWHLFLYALVASGASTLLLVAWEKVSAKAPPALASEPPSPEHKTPAPSPPSVAPPSKVEKDQPGTSPNQQSKVPVTDSDKSNVERGKQEASKRDQIDSPVVAAPTAASAPPPALKPSTDKVDCVTKPIERKANEPCGDLEEAASTPRTEPESKDVRKKPPSPVAPTAAEIESTETSKPSVASASASTSPAAEMADSDLDLDDMLDDAFDEMDILDSVADDMLMEASPKPMAKTNTTAPKTWQDTLTVLDPEERLEWARTISRDITAQSNMPPQPVYSSAYKDGEGGEGENAVSAIVQGTAVLTLTEADSLLDAALKKSVVVVNKRDSKGYTASDKVRSLFREHLQHEIKERFTSHPIEEENIKAEPERFKSCAALLGSA